MGARYLNDLIAYRHGNVADVYHPEDVRDNLRRYTALSVSRQTGRRLMYHEIGSLVMGAIDGLNYLNARYGLVDTRAMTWYGVDNSRFMNAMALYTHEGYDIHLSETTAAVPCDLFFAKACHCFMRSTTRRCSATSSRRAASPSSTIRSCAIAECRMSLELDCS